jgi:hypothetical protein
MYFVNDEYFVAIPRGRDLNVPMITSRTLSMPV